MFSEDTVPVVVFAKPPRPGHSKTRLARTLGPERAAEFAAAFLEDTLERLAQGDEGPVYVRGAAPRREDFGGGVPPTIRYDPQGDGDLGARLKRAFRSLARGPARGSIALGADTPHLPLERLREAREAVRRGEVVVGPAADGGYYLLGLPCEFAGLDALFDHGHWGGDEVLAITRTVLCQSSFPWRELGEFSDIDHWDDLVQWSEELRTHDPPHPMPHRTLGLLERELKKRRPGRSTGGDCGPRGRPGQ